MPNAPKLPPGSENFFNPSGSYIKDVDSLIAKYKSGFDTPSDYSRFANKYNLDLKGVMKRIRELAANEGSSLDSKLVKAEPAKMFDTEPSRSLKPELVKAEPAKMFDTEPSRSLGPKPVQAKLTELSPFEEAALKDFLAAEKTKTAQQIAKNIRPAGIGSKFINAASDVAGRVRSKVLSGQALRAVERAAEKFSGPLGAALTAAELAGALSEVRKLGAEKIAKGNALTESEKRSQELKAATEYKGPYTPEERLKIRGMLNKLRGEAKLRE